MYRNNMQCKIIIVENDGIWLAGNNYFNFNKIEKWNKLTDKSKFWQMLILKAICLGKHE